MADPFVGEIRLFAGNFPPQGWAFCDGTTMPIQENVVLFTLIGTTYGGDGQTTFNLPDLRGRVPVHQAAGYAMGQQGGAENVSLAPQQLPAHTHAWMASTNAAASTKGPTDALGVSTMNMYGSAAPSMPMEPTAVTSAGGSQAHDNMAPFTAINYIIALFGIFPSQN